MNGEAVGVGAVTGSFISGRQASIGGGGTAPSAEKGGGGVGELLLELELEGPLTGARVDVMIFLKEARPPKFAFRLRFKPC